MPLEPGAITIEASAPGFASSRLVFDLKPGQSRVVPLALRPLASRTATPAQYEPAPIRPTARQSDESASHEAASTARGSTTLQPPAAADSAALESPGGGRWLSYAAWGVGAIGIGVGVTFGIATIQAKSELADVCPQNRCAADQQPRIDNAHRNGTLANAAFGVGLVSAVVGTVLFFATAPEPSIGRAEARSGVGLALSPGGVQLLGSFD